MQATNHGEGEAALSRENLVHSVQATNHGHEVLGNQPFPLHGEPDGGDRIGSLHREVLPFIDLDERDENVETISGRSSGLGAHE